ncbi:MAG: 40S ribosomal protein S19 [Nanoarchaeota archaeon]|nr:40S ribosomal protein S19 [Nanoarchaeota archaeon]
MGIYSIPNREFNEKLAKALKEFPEFEQPDWSFFVKTSVARERPPQESEFWHKRAASILKQIYIKKIIGVNKLKTRYGGKKDRGAKPSKFKKGSGKIIRVILQQADKAGLTETVKGKKAGRRLTEQGKKLLEEIK